MCTIREKMSRVDRPEDWLRCAAHHADKSKLNNEALSINDYRKAMMLVQNHRRVREEGQ